MVFSKKGFSKYKFTNEAKKHKFLLKDIGVDVSKISLNYLLKNEFFRENVENKKDSISNFE